MSYRMRVPFLSHRNVSVCVGQLNQKDLREAGHLSITLRAASYRLSDAEENTLAREQADLIECQASPSLNRSAPKARPLLLTGQDRTPARGCFLSYRLHPRSCAAPPRQSSAKQIFHLTCRSLDAVKNILKRESQPLGGNP